MPFIIPLALGLALSCLIGMVAYRRGSLSESGVVGAIVTGTLIFGFGGLLPGLLLVAFFVSSSLLSHYHLERKTELASRSQKGARRDLGQALANGGWAAVLAIAYGIAFQSNRVPLPALLFAGIVGALATVTADTWATEIGALNNSPPRMITTGRMVPTGTSGAITPLGTVAALMGGLFIGIIAALGVFLPSVEDALGGATSAPITQYLTLWVDLLPRLAWIGGASGLLGALFDSLLGATVQAIYFCEYDETQTESKIHTCGRATRLLRGWRWLDNDGVNFIASVLGSLVAVGLALVLL